MLDNKSAPKAMPDAPAPTLVHPTKATAQPKKRKILEVSQAQLDAAFAEAVEDPEVAVSEKPAEAANAVSKVSRPAKKDSPWRLRSHTLSRLTFSPPGCCCCCYLLPAGVPGCRLAAAVGRPVATRVVHAWPTLMATRGPLAAASGPHHP